MQDKHYLYRHIIKEIQADAWNEAIEAAAELVKEKVMRYGSVSKSIILDLKK